MDDDPLTDRASLDGISGVGPLLAGHWNLSPAPGVFMRPSLSRLAAIAVAASCLVSSVAVHAQATPVSSPIASPVATPVAGGIGNVRVIATATLPNDLEVDGTLVGGLSGIDYNPSTGAWVVISDDRSEYAPARYYDLDLAYDENAIGTLELTSAVTLLQADGSPYPNVNDGGNIPDLESIRFDPQSGNLWYTSEGSYEFGLDPFVAETDPQGQLNASTLPAVFSMSGGEELGPRENLVFEGLTFSANGESLWVAMEGPLYQDSEPSTFETTSTTRITNIDRSGNVLAQYAYELDTLPEEPTAFATIGVTEILAIDETRFLVIERGGIETPDAFNNYIKVYEVDIAGATDIATLPALEGQEFTPATKRLVLDLNATDVTPIDNIEGITWGPVLDNGNRTLVLVADNNFNETQVNQFVVLAIEAW
jgi:hypothetical protein